MHPYVRVLTTYMAALGQSDYTTVKGLFAPKGRVRSPFLGELPAGPFFDRLAGASSRNVITPIDIFLSESRRNHATAYFQYDWTVRDGTLITFKVMDLFTFEPEGDQVMHLDLIYDTHPIRESAGNKYETRPAVALVRWQSLTPDQQQAVLALQIPEAQREFAGTIERAVAACEAASGDDVAGLGILLGARPVGFVVLSRGSKQPAWAPAGSAAITAMRVDAREQGKGLGRAALTQLDSWVRAHWRTTQVLALCVDEENHAGRRAYAAAGFTEYAERQPGRIGVVLYLAKQLVQAGNAA